MTPEDALHILDQMSARATGNRADHIAVAEALETLRAVITPEFPLPEESDVAHTEDDSPHRND